MQPVSASWSTVPPRSPQARTLGRDRSCARRLRSLGRWVASQHRPQWAAALALAALTPGTPRVPTHGIRWPAPAYVADWNLKPGLRANYETNCQPGVRCEVDLAILGEQDVKGRRLYELRISSRLARSPSDFVNDAKFTIRDGSLVFLEETAEVPGHPPMELPPLWAFTWTRGEAAMVSGYTAPYTWGVFTVQAPSSCSGWGRMYNPCFFSTLSSQPSGIPRANALSEEVVRTPAGTFRCRHWRFQGGPDADVWIAKGAGPFGIVKARARGWPRGRTLTLTLTGVEAVAPSAVAAPPSPPRPDELWTWIWQQRDILTNLCLPQLGLPWPVDLYL